MPTQLVGHRDYRLQDPFRDLLKSDGAGALEQCVYVSLMSDARVDAGESPNGDNDRRGWWADTYSNENTGSKLWLINKSTPENLRRFDDYANQSLLWMVRDGLAKSVNSRTIQADKNITLTVIDITKPDGKTESFKYSGLWEALIYGT